MGFYFIHASTLSFSVHSPSSLLVHILQQMLGNKVFFMDSLSRQV